MKLHFCLSKKISTLSTSCIRWIIVLVVAFIVIIPCIGGVVGKFGADMFNSSGLRSFAYGNGICKDNLGLLSAIAYALGVIFFSGILIPVITNYLRTIGERYLNGTLDRYSWKDHILFLGYDELMIATLRERCRQGREIVVAVPKEVKEIRIRLQGLLHSDELKHVEVVQCNKTDRNDLQKKACVAAASQLFFIGQPDDPTHDASNLKSLDVAAEILGNDTNVISYIYIRNRASLSLVQRQGFVGEDVMKLRKIVNPFNFYENIAGKLIAGFESGKTLMNIDYHDEKKNLAVCPDAKAHLVILGMTEVGMALAREVLMVAHYPKRRVTITLVDEKAREEMFFFRGRYKELFKNCNYTFEDYDDKEKDPDPSSGDKTLLDVDFEFVQASVAHPKLMKQIETWSKDDKQILTLVVCTADSPKNMATALYLPRTLMEGDAAIPVWVYQQGDDSLKEFSRHVFYKNIHTFSAAEYGAVAMHGSTALSWAEEVAGAYESSATKKKTSKKWNEMSQYERWSSLYNVRSIITKLRGLGYAMVKDNDKITLKCFADGNMRECSHLDLSDEAILELAETEHVRWIADTLTKGFRPTSDEEHHRISADKPLKNLYKKELFAHDDLRPYAELDEKTAAYDVDMTKSMINAINSQLGK